MFIQAGQSRPSNRNSLYSSNPITNANWCKEYSSGVDFHRLRSSIINMASTKAEPSKQLLLCSLVASVISLCLALSAVAYLVLVAQTSCTCPVAREGGRQKWSNAASTDQADAPERAKSADKSEERNDPAKPWHAPGNALVESSEKDEAEDILSLRRDRRENQANQGPSSDYVYDTLIKVQQSVAVLKTRYVTKVNVILAPELQRELLCWVGLVSWVQQTSRMSRMRFSLFCTD